MPRFFPVAALAALFCLAVPAAFSAPPSSSTGSVVIVFKDGHRQSFNLSEIARIEFPGSSEASNDSSSYPSRSHFLGKWEAGDGSGGNFYITLYDNGDARRSIGNVHGRWDYVDGEAHINWDDGAKDAIRKSGSRYQKSAYSSNKSFTDLPDNVTAARNTTPHPI